MSKGVVQVGTKLDIGDHGLTVLTTPEETGDRYVIRIVAEPGGPGIRGDFPHSHPALTETFTCVSGEMTVRVGRRVWALHPGETAEAPPGSVHGFLNTGNSPLTVDGEVIFRDGYTPDVDLLRFAAIYDRLRVDGPVRAKDGEPPFLQMAVLTDAYRRAIRVPGLAGMLIRPLAAIGRLRGYRSPEER